jgi:hypothetical protein
MTNTKDYTNEEFLNSKNKKEIANVNSIGENIIHDENLVPNGLGNNTLYQVGNQLERPEIVNDNKVNDNKVNDNKVNANNINVNNIIVNKEQISVVEKKDNIQMVINDIEETEVTKELKNLSNKSNNNKLNNNKLNNNKSNNYKSNNYKLNNHKLNNNNSTIMIILEELKKIFPLSVIISIVIFVLIFIYIVRF